MVTISNDTPDDDLRSDKRILKISTTIKDGDKTAESKFIKTFSLPNSQMHYRPDRILELNETEVLIEGVEGSTNMRIRVKMLRGMFDTIIESNPNARFLIDDWNKRRHQ